MEQFDWTQVSEIAPADLPDLITTYLDRLLSLYKTHLVQSLTISSFHAAP